MDLKITDTLLYTDKMETDNGIRIKYRTIQPEEIRAINKNYVLLYDGSCIDVDSCEKIH